MKLLRTNRLPRLPENTVVDISMTLGELYDLAATVGAIAGVRPQAIRDFYRLAKDIEGVPLQPLTERGYFFDHSADSPYLKRLLP